MRTSVSLIALVALFGCNEPPGAPVVAISPEEPTTLDGLSASIVQESVDPNKNDAVTYTWSWTRDGAAVAEVTGPDVPAELTKRGETWTVTVIPADDKEQGASAQASITIGNAVPSAEVEITPDAPLSTDDLIAEITTSDPDGDTVNAQISWKVDGVDARISSERVPKDRTSRGEVWEVTVLPKDARGQGEAVTASKQIANQPPTVESVRIRPDLAYEASVLEAIVDANDNDGDDLTYTAVWSVNGVELTEVTVLELDGTYFDKDDSVSVSIVANDGLIDSAPLASDPVVILNTPPRLTSATIAPAEAYEGDTLSCTPAGWSDEDGDSESYRYEWRVQGELAGTGTTLTSDFFGKGDRVSCTVFPNDGTDDGIPVSARPIVIANTPPVVGSITISPTDPMTGTAVVSTVTGVSDVDDDAVRLDIDWFVAGTKVASGPSLAGTAFTRDKEIYAEVTPYDGTDFGTKVKSNVARSRNAPPSITSFTLTPSPVYTDSTVGLTVGTADPDFDTVTLTYEWTLNGSSYGSGSTTSVPSTDITRGDVLTYKATPNDGTIDGPARSGSVTVVNKPPTTPEIDIDPAEPEKEDDLLCEILTASTDADSDRLTYTFSWKKDGVAWTGTTSTTTYAKDTIPSSVTSDGENWECTVSVTDGTATVSDVVDRWVAGPLVPGFSGERGPIMGSGWTQCEGYLDKSGGDDIPLDWGDDCDDSTYSSIRLVCGDSTSKYRYIELKKNFFYYGATAYPERGQIVDARDQSGSSFSYTDNVVYLTSSGGYKVENGRSWWAGGTGCNESAPTITINNVCTWEASNCFGQNLTGERYLWVYVKK